MKHRLMIVFFAPLALSLGAVGCTETPDYPENDAALQSDGGGDASDVTADGDVCGECPADSPVCDEDEGECVECLGDEDCDEGVCTDDAACVECRGDEDCDEGVCDTEHDACVECLDHGDCAEPDAPACGDDNACTSCSDDDHCEHLDDVFVCDDGAGACVECTVDDESPCGDNACDPATNTCTDTERGSLSTCEPCRADSQCRDDHRCVPMEFDGQALDDGFCLKTLSSNCDNPFRTPVERESLSGAESEDYCGINEEVTTCWAVLDLLDDEECEDDQDCGHADLSDGRCERVTGADNRCTYSCSSDRQCEEDVNCAEGETDTKYCGGG